MSRDLFHLAVGASVFMGLILPAAHAAEQWPSAKGVTQTDTLDNRHDDASGSNPGSPELSQ
ncbi:MAG: hypothetical protein ACE365_01620 [Gammaproteobacteria bacterium]